MAEYDYTLNPYSGCSFGCMEAAGALLRTARQRGGLSQAELARRAGLTQSVISAYESGARQPSLATLARLVAATGSDLEVRVSPPSDVGDLGGPLARRVQEHRYEVLALLDRCGLTNPRLFGSAARGDDKPGSDIDLLVDVPPRRSRPTELGPLSSPTRSPAERPRRPRSRRRPQSRSRQRRARRGRRPVSRRDRQCLENILAAIDTIASHLQRGDLHDGLVFDAVRVRLTEIGEAVEALPGDLLTTEAGLPWAQIAGNARPGRPSLPRHLPRHPRCHRRRRPPPARSSDPPSPPTHRTDVIVRARASVTAARPAYAVTAPIDAPERRPDQHNKPPRSTCRVREPAPRHTWCRSPRYQVW